MDRRDGCQDTDVGRGDGAQILYVPCVGGSHLENENLCTRVGGQDGEGKADLVVQVPCRRRDTPPGMPENGREGVLGRRLAHSARNPDNGGRRRVLAQKRPACEPLQRLQGVVHDEGRHVEPAGRHRRHRAAQVRLGGEVRAVGPAAQGEEQVPFAHLAGIGLRPHRRGRLRVWSGAPRP